MVIRTPLSAEQAGVWFTEQLGGAGASYHLPITVEFDGELDTGAMRRACATVVARHPILGCTLEVTAGNPCLVPASSPPKLAVVDLTGTEETERTAAIEARVRAETIQPFGADGEPLSRFILLVAGPARHVLVVVGHHLVFDGQSKDILVTELAAAYRAAIGGCAVDGADAAGETGPGVARVPQPPDLDGEMDLAEQYWRQRWHAPAPVILPGLAPAGQRTAAGMDAEPAVTDVALPPGTADAVRRTAADLAVTSYELLLAVIAAMLARYGNDPVTVAVDLGTRTAATRDRIGMFVNQLPLTGPTDCEQSFRAFVAATRCALRELYPLRRVTLSRVVPGVPAGLALAPVSISYRKVASAPRWPGSLTARVDWSRFGHAALETLHIMITDGDDGLAVRLHYRPSTLSPAGAAAVAGHLRTMLAAALANTSQSVASLELLTPAEHELIVARWNRTDAAFPDSTTIDQLIATQAHSTPRALAVESDGPDGERLTYAELNTRANQLAHLLRELGAAPGQIIGVLARRSADLATGLLAVLKAGAAYLPLDPELPDERLRFMLSDAGVRLVLVASVLAPRLNALTHQQKPVLLEHEPTGQPASDPTPLAGPADPAYLMYTSGSAGQPKGVLNSHRGLVNRLDWMQRAFRLGADDAVLQKTPIGFDVSVWEFFWPLLAGARLVVAVPGGHRDPLYLQSVIRTRQVTTVHFVPSMLALFLAEPGAPDCTSLRRTICSGEELSPALAADFLRLMPGELHNLYGPTEAAIDVSSWRCLAERVREATRLPIGAPIQNMRLYVVDRWGGVLPAGIAGELLIGGPGVAAGYLGRPGLTAEKFIPDYFRPGGSRLYRTGDLARWREDGTVEFLGRMDRQVKLRGNRIEPGEVEAAILSFPGISQTAVLVTGEGADQRLIAHLAPGPHAADPDLPGRLRKHLAGQLPDYMIPAAFAIADSLPLTPNGKLDYAALARGAPSLPRALPRAMPSRNGSQAAGRLTEDIRAIWCEVLRADAIGLDDDLFSLGGHSLTITQIAARMRRRLGIDLPLQVFYDTPTISAVAAAARDLQD